MAIEARIRLPVESTIDAALQNGFVKLAEMRLASAKVFAARLPEEHPEHFGELERKIAAAKAGPSSGN